MASNYPPGVSGNEPQIAGYDERVISCGCPECGQDVEVEAYLIFVDRIAREATFGFECPECGAETEVTLD